MDEVSGGVGKNIRTRFESISVFALTCIRAVQLMCSQRDRLIGVNRESGVFFDYVRRDKYVLISQPLGSFLFPTDAEEYSKVAASLQRHSKMILCDECK